MNLFNTRDAVKNRPWHPDSKTSKRVERAAFKAAGNSAIQSAYNLGFRGEVAKDYVENLLTQQGFEWQYQRLGPRGVDSRWLTEPWIDLIGLDGLWFARWSV